MRLGIWAPVIVALNATESLNRYVVPPLVANDTSKLFAPPVAVMAKIDDNTPSVLVRWFIQNETPIAPVVGIRL